MNLKDKERLYNQLPAIYRIRDKKEGEPLRALLTVVETELEAIEKDIEGLYNNWFIETCEDWVVPYIGDLLGVRNLHNIGSGVSQRAYVANTLAYRRRKGTPAVIEQLAWSVTGWYARVVEFFNSLAATQNMNHLRSDCTTIDLHNAEGLELLGSPFERASHTVDVRRMDRNGGRYNIPNIGIFLWRLQSYYIERCTARKVGEGRYTFSPLGKDAPLFNQPQTERDITQIAEEVNVPGMLRRRALYNDIEMYRKAIETGDAKPESRYFGGTPVFTILNGLTPFEPEFLMICDLSNWDAPGWKPPESQNFKRYNNPDYATQVAVDPVLGRLVFLTGAPSSPLEVSYSYGFSGDMGAGPYERELENELMVAGQKKNVWKKTVSQQDEKPDYATLNDALADWAQSKTYLFSWDEIPGSDSARLIDFLKQEYHIDWAESLKIEKINGDKTIKVSTEKNSLTLKLNDETKVDLKIDDGRIDKFFVKKEEDKLNIYSKANAVITITDNSTYEVKDITLELQDDECLVIQANNGNRPMLRIIDNDGNLTTLNVSGGNGSAKLILNGLLIEGGIYIDEESLGQIRIVHCTLMPRWSLDEPSMNAAERNGYLQVEIDHSIVGSLCLPAEIDNLSVQDSIIDPGIINPLARYLFGWDPVNEKYRIIGYIRDKFGLEWLDPVYAITRKIDRGNTIRIKGPFVWPPFLQNYILIRLNKTRTRATLTISTDERTDEFIVKKEKGKLNIYSGRKCAISSKNVDTGPPATIERSTVFGEVHVKQLTDSSNVIFTDLVFVEKRQDNCLRFSYVPDGSQTPRRYRCQPDLEIAKQIEMEEKKAKENKNPLDNSQRESIKGRVLSWLVPDFTSRRYGDPSYGQLHASCPEQIRTGADDGSEMGSFHHQKQPQREANLRAALDEYLRFGLEAGLFYIN